VVEASPLLQVLNLMLDKITFGGTSCVLTIEKPDPLDTTSIKQTHTCRFLY
jgi:hypothetical protein